MLESVEQSCTSCRRQRDMLWAFLMDQPERDQYEVTPSIVLVLVYAVCD